MTPPYSSQTLAASRRNGAARRRWCPKSSLRAELRQGRACLVGFARARIELQGGFERLPCRRRIAALRVRQAQVVLELGVIRRFAGGFLQRRESLSDEALLEIDPP